MSTQSERSSVERVKEQSRHLRGAILEELELPTPNFSKETVQILKFHGVYQQTDRDARKAGVTGYGSMVRVGIPGGVLSPEQYLLLDRLADEVGDGGLRITTRQDAQFHRTRKADLRYLISTLNRNLLTTLAACGDVVRNTTCCPAPHSDPVRAELQRRALALSRRLKPKTRAYYEIWMDGEKAAAAETEEEPLYGDCYLPRKFKIGFAPPGDNCIDVYSNDVGLVPVCRGETIQAYTLLAGGGLGMSPGAKATHPRLADPICTVPPELLEDAVEACVTIHRDYGNRSNRKFARLKYVLEDWGVERFRKELEARLGTELAPPAKLEWNKGADHLGWQRQDDTCLYLGLHVPSGRIRGPLRDCLREIVSEFQPGVRFTCHQNVLLTGIPADRRAEIDNLLRRYGASMPSELPPVIQEALACPALPTCGLAITEAERAMPDILADIERTLREVGLDGLPVTVRVTGCPNGCARPYTAEIGIVGQSVDMYALYLGGSHLSLRIGALFTDRVRREEIGAALRSAFVLFRERRNPGERFGDFCHRVGVAALRGAAVEAPA
ncbi:MAG TPA: NADPH-dependent assimilatory sulfite reductase hemoprotein subunit [Bryobacteraceae bacterium]|nr:NADPH-dependent assimilatory sulfite reductase hemoprotein subunit [Bryobacteraceae bacterium]